MRLHLVRHPRTGIAEGVCYGSSDLATVIDDSLRVQLLAALPSAVPLYSSPLKRCADLAETLAPALSSGSPIYDPRLAEMHFGEWEMRAWTDIPREEVDAWTKNLIHYRPGGGESVLEVAQRVQAFRNEMAMQDGDAIVICHAGTIRLLIAATQRLSPEELALSAARQAHAVGYGAVTVVELTQ